MSMLGYYLLRRVSIAVLVVLFILLGLFLIGALAEQIGKTGNGNYSVVQALIYTLLHAPQHLHDLSQISVLTGTVLALALLSRSNELLVLRSVVSRGKLLLLLLFIGLLFALFAFANSEYLVSSGRAMAEELRQRARTGESPVRRDLWFRHEQKHIHIQRAWLDGHLEGVRIYEYDPGRRLKSVIEAESGWYIGRQWLLERPRQRTFSEQGVRELRGLEREVYDLGRVPDVLSSGGVEVEYLPIRILYSYTQYLRSNERSDHRYELVLWSRLVHILSIPWLVLLALPLGWGFRRGQTASSKTILGALCGLAYYSLGSLSFQLGILSGVQSALFVVLPLGILSFATVCLLLRMR